MSAPAVVIRLELEAPPRLFADALGKNEWKRLSDWLSAHPRYLRLIQEAIALETEERTA
jgi:hypothetical protein